MSDFQYAQLNWDENGQPLSCTYDDVYFSRHFGLNETRHVFLSANHLTERFAQLRTGDALCIGETGFGTGLNFLCAWQLLDQVAMPGARLQFVSVEKLPLAEADLRRALALWPELAPWAKQLLEQYVALHPGFQRLVFANGRVSLTLLIGDALDSLSELDAQVDSWFLDGFAPAKNPDMWSAKLFTELARLSRPEATLSTFTSAGFVRRGLLEAGFDMQRVPGYRQKREMLSGAYQGPSATFNKPWYARPSEAIERREVLVIGGGLAGCASAASLAARGWKVTLIERHSTLASEASGNPQGVLYLKLSAHNTLLSRLVVSGFGYTRRILQRLPRGRDWDACGMLQLAFSDKEAQRQAQLVAAFPKDLLRAVSQEDAERIAGVGLAAGGLFYPEAGWVHPSALCHALTSDTINVVTSRVVQLHREGQDWCAYAGDTCLGRAPVAVLATAADNYAFSPIAKLPLKRIRGQITLLPATLESRALNTVICAKGYIAPPRGDKHILGASFNFNNDDPAPALAEHQSNLELLRDISADLLQRLRIEQLPLKNLEGRTAFRCTTPDYLPLIGPLAERRTFDSIYAVLAKDARQVPEQSCPWLEGLYLNNGHGSRGLISAPLSGELLAAWICNEPLPLPRAVAEACHPNRFLLRDLIKSQQN